MLFLLLLMVNIVFDAWIIILIKRYFKWVLSMQIFLCCSIKVLNLYRTLHPVFLFPCATSLFNKAVPEPQLHAMKVCPFDNFTGIIYRKVCRPIFVFTVPSVAVVTLMFGYEVRQLCAG